MIRDALPSNYRLVIGGCTDDMDSHSYYFIEEKTIGFFGFTKWTLKASCRVDLNMFESEDAEFLLFLESKIPSVETLLI